MAATPNGSGYWLTNAAGDVSAHGSAVSYGSLAGTTLQAPITHIVSTPDGKGYWLVAADGGIFTFGDAGFFGSTGAMTAERPGGGHGADSRRERVLAGRRRTVASSPSATPYSRAPWAAVHLNKPVVGIAADNATGGYWLVASDGGIFSFGAPVPRLDGEHRPEQARQRHDAHRGRRGLPLRGE